MTSNSKPKPQAKTSQAEPKPAPAIIVFGADQASKPRAASFTGDEVEAATKAAELMKLRVLKVAGPELTELAASLQAGRIYASGHGFVPPIRPSIYERLACASVTPRPSSLRMARNVCPAFPPPTTAGRVRFAGGAQPSGSA